MTIMASSSNCRHLHRPTDYAPTHYLRHFHSPHVVRRGTASLRARPRHIPGALRSPAFQIARRQFFARGDYYTDGYWNKKIDLATLSVAETMQANANRSVKFVLPSSPNEVITRP